VGINHEEIKVWVEAMVMMKVMFMLVAVAMLSLSAADFPAKASTSGTGDFYLPRDAAGDDDVMIPSSAVVQNSGQPPNTEEVQNLIEMASVTFVTCDYLLDNPNPNPSLNSLLMQQCDHNLKFLKGLCESSSNAYDYCTDTKMDSYMIVRGQYSAPRPIDVWCNVYIDKCIELGGIAKSNAINLFGEDVAANLVDIYDDKIEILEQKKAAQGHDENDD